MHIALGVLSGIIGFLPLFLSLRLSRRSRSTQALILGMYGLAGVCVSLLVLIVATVACGILARDAIVPFVIAEAVVFLGSTIAYVMYKNAPAKRKRGQ